MERTVKYSRIESVLSELSYPIERADAIDRLEEVTLLLADGEENLGEVVERSNDDVYESAADLEDDILTNLPREAVGEPYQSEGEG